MRALFEDKAFAATTALWFDIHEVGLPQNTNRRDVWFYVEANASPSVDNIYAYKTRAEAQAAATAADEGTAWIAKKESINPGDVVLTLDDNPLNAPDMSDLKIQVTASVSAQPITIRSVWGYTAAPQLVVADNIKTRLLTFMAAGKSLEAFGTENIRVGYPTEAMPPRCISIRPMTGGRGNPGSGGTGSTESRIFPIEVYTAVAGLYDLSDPFLGYRTCAEHQAAIETILFDEYRTSYGEVLGLYHERSEDPDLVAYEDQLWIAVTRLNAEFHAMWRDDTYPRH